MFTSHLHKMTEHPGFPEGVQAQSSTRFPFTLLMKITASEPRDVLASERTALTFVRFSTTLFFAALAILLDFRFETNGSGTRSPRAGAAFSSGTSFVLLGLSLALLVISGVNYFVSIKKLASHKIITIGSTSNSATVIIMTALVVVLVGICVSLVIEGYGEGVK